MGEHSLTTHMPKPQIGVLPTGHKIYWSQFPQLKSMGEQMFAKLVNGLEGVGDVVSPQLVDTQDESLNAARFFAEHPIDILLIFPFGYTTGMMIVPVVRDLQLPIRILNVHEDRTYDYRNADTALYLHHEGICCVPEYAGTLKRLRKSFRVITGPMESSELWDEIRADCEGAAAARIFKTLKFGVIGETYSGMTDMPIDEHRLLDSTGRLVVRPEVEEILNAAESVNQQRLEKMYQEIRTLFDVDPTVTDEHLQDSARLAIAYEEVIVRHDLSAFGYFWWGERQEVTQLRSQSSIAVSRLAALGRPGVTEGDLKTAMAMKILDLLGAGGMFVEFFSIDYDEEFILVGHDGPSNIALSHGKPKLQHLDVHHGKSGHGLGIDFEMTPGVVTLLNLTQFGDGQRFKFVLTVGEIVVGDTLRIGNPNCRIKVKRDIRAFMNDWCQEGPSHHIAVGYGDKRRQLRVFAESIGFEVAEV